MGMGLFWNARAPLGILIKMVALISLNSVGFYMSIPSSNGVLECLLFAIMLRKLDGENRAGNVQKQSHFLRMKHQNIRA